MQPETVTTPSVAPSAPNQDAVAPARLESFDFKGHLKRTGSAQNAARHIKIGVENWLTTELMKLAVKNQPAVPAHYRPREGQYEQIQKELHSYCAKDKFAMVLATMPFLGTFRDDGRIDWLSEMGAYQPLHYPSYFLQPFHSIPGGWLNPLAAVGNTAAFAALYRRAHKHGAPGLRDDIARLVPKSAKVVYDFGASTGEQSVAILQHLGDDATVVAIDPAPPGLIVGKRQIRDPRLQWIHGFVEEQELTPNSADAVDLMFVAHECPDPIKRKLLKAAFDVLKPGGVLVWTDPPPDDLFLASRGFFEPYALRWQQWSPERELQEVGFTKVETHYVVDPMYMWTRVATK